MACAFAEGPGVTGSEEVWPYVSLDNIMDSITLHSSNMFLDLANSLKWNGSKCSQYMSITQDGSCASLKPHAQFDAFLGQATVLGLREYSRTEVHSWVVRLEQVGLGCIAHADCQYVLLASHIDDASSKVGCFASMFTISMCEADVGYHSTKDSGSNPALLARIVNTLLFHAMQPVGTAPANFLVGVAPATMDLNHSIGQEGCGIGLDYYGYIYINGRYFHISNLSNWQQVAKPCRGSTARHKGKNGPQFQFHDGKCEITLTLDLKEGTLKFSSAGHSIGTIANIKGPLHAALTLTSTKQSAVLAAGELSIYDDTYIDCVIYPVECNLSATVDQPIACTHHHNSISCDALLSCLSLVCARANWQGRAHS